MSNLPLFFCLELAERRTSAPFVVSEKNPGRRAHLSWHADCNLFYCVLLVSGFVSVLVCVL